MKLIDLIGPGSPPARVWVAPGIDLDRLFEEALAGGGVRAVLLEGRALSAEAAFFAAVAGRLDFPDYFGRNWDALDECLADLDWIAEPVVVVAVRNADALLAAAPEGLRPLLDLLAAREASPPSPSLRLLLQVERGAAKALQRRVEAAGHRLPSWPP